MTDGWYALNKGTAAAGSPQEPALAARACVTEDEKLCKLEDWHAYLDVFLSNGKGRDLRNGKESGEEGKSELHCEKDCKLLE